MAQIRPAKRRRTDVSPSKNIAERQIAEVGGATYIIYAPGPNSVDISIVAPASQATQASGEVPDGFMFPVLPYTTQAPVAQTPAIQTTAIQQGTVVPAVQLPPSQTPAIQQSVVVPVAQSPPVQTPAIQQTVVVPAAQSPPAQTPAIQQNTIVPVAQPPPAQTPALQTTAVQQTTVVPAAQSLANQTPAIQQTVVVPAVQPPPNQTPAIQPNTVVPVVTTLATTATANAGAGPPPPAVVPQPPAVTGPPIPMQGASSMVTALREGTTSFEAQSQPSVGAMASQPDAATAKMNVATEKILIACGSIAGVLVLIFLILVLHRWRKGHKPFSRLISWSKPVDEEDEEDAQTYAAPIPEFDARFSTYQKPIWEVNSSLSSLPQKPYMAFNPVNPTSTSLHKPAMPSQSRFPPPNRIRMEAPDVEPKLYYRNPFSDSNNIQNRSDVRGVRIAEAEVAPSESSLEVPIMGPPTDDFRYQEPATRQTFGAQPQMREKDSRFSWTNSHPRSPPRPPRELTNKKTNNNINDERWTASTASELGYNTVDGWVGQQTNRLVEFQIQQLFDDALDGRPRPGSPGVSPKSPAPIAEAVMPLYVPENYKEEAMLRMMESSPNNSRSNLVPYPPPPSEPQQMSAMRKMGVAATSLYENLARGRYIR